MARILVIEDNPANLDLMTYMLGATGHVALTAGDGRSGLIVARAQNPDLIICDVQLPVLDGIEVARQLKADPDYAQIPLLAVTALAMVGDRERLLRAGFDGYLTKPIEPETFVSQVESFLGFRPPTQNRPAQTDPSSSRDTATVTGARILIVDNHPVNLELAVSLLEGSGYEVLTADNPETGLELARSRQPALIVSDVCMGTESGYDFLAQVKKDPLLRSVPFVFLTSTAASGREQAHGMSLGARRYLIRPIEPERLLSEVAACLGSRPSPGDSGTNASNEIGDS